MLRDNNKKATPVKNDSCFENHTFQPQLVKDYRHRTVTTPTQTLLFTERMWEGAFFTLQKPKGNWGTRKNVWKHGEKEFERKGGERMIIFIFFPVAHPWNSFLILCKIAWFSCRMTWFSAGKPSTKPSRLFEGTPEQCRVKWVCSENEKW